MEIVYKQPKYKLFLKSKSQLAYVFKKYFQPASTKQAESTASTQYQTLLTQISIEKQALTILTGFFCCKTRFFKIIVNRYCVFQLYILFSASFFPGYRINTANHSSARVYQS